MNLQWETGRRKVSELKHWEDNPRKITPEKLEDLKDKIRERGFHDVLKLDEAGMILSGNMRKEALEQLGIEEVNVLIPSRKLTTEEKVLVGLESNVLAGEWNWELLGGFDKDLLEKAGFGEEDMRVNFGISDAEMEQVDMGRMQLLAVMPPESPRLKEKAVIHFENIGDYRKVKKAIEDGRLSSESLLKML